MSYYRYYYVTEVKDLPRRAPMRVTPSADLAAWAAVGEGKDVAVLDLSPEAVLEVARDGRRMGDWYWTREPVALSFFFSECPGGDPALLTRYLFWVEEQMQGRLFAASPDLAAPAEGRVSMRPVEKEIRAFRLKHGREPTREELGKMTWRRE